MDVATVEALAPDQASLKAASKLMKPAKWPVRERDSASGLLWAECQGSGANPYRVAVDTSNNGYKCTCPSRKFPCKHALATMWMFAVDESVFVPGTVPDWVGDWLSRRRNTTATSTVATQPTAQKKSAAAAALPEVETPPDPKAEARKAKAAEKRAKATRASVEAASRDMEQWIADQLRTGLSGFLADPTTHCRRIASRLVDAKAAVLASRIDEMPARLMALPTEERFDAAVAEFGKLVLLARAWRAAPQDPELTSAVISADDRETVLNTPDARRSKGVWEVLGERVVTRRDGLISQATWLLNLRTAEPAQLLDFFPASTGRRAGAFTPGDQFNADLTYYPGLATMRAIISERTAYDGERLPWPATPADDLLAPYVAALQAAPWTLEAPLFLPAGRICIDDNGDHWWRATTGDEAFPLYAGARSFTLGAELSCAAGIWTGRRLHMLSGQSSWGHVDFNA